MGYPELENRAGCNTGRAGRRFEGEFKNQNAPVRQDRACGAFAPGRCFGQAFYVGVVSDGGWRKRDQSTQIHDGDSSGRKPRNWRRCTVV